jgi:DNA-binding NarL/FixJ family response regulator
VDFLRVLLVDSHEAYRRQICLLLESVAGLEICGESDTIEQGILKSSELNPDVIILEFDSPLQEGFEAARKMRQVVRAPIIVLSIYRSKELIEEIKAMGMQGYVEKIQAADLLLPTIEAVLKGQTFFPENAAD